MFRAIFMVSKREEKRALSSEEGSQRVLARVLGFVTLCCGHLYMGFPNKGFLLLSENSLLDFVNKKNIICFSINIYII